MYTASWMLWVTYDDASCASAPRCRAAPPASACASGRRARRTARPSGARRGRRRARARCPRAAACRPRAGAGTCPRSRRARSARRSARARSRALGRGQAELLEAELDVAAAPCATGTARTPGRPSRSSGAPARGAALEVDAPAVGGSSPATMLSSVDLPQPDGPSRATNSSGSTVRLTSSSAGTAWPRAIAIRLRHAARRRRARQGRVAQAEALDLARRRSSAGRRRTRSTRGTL